MLDPILAEFSALVTEVELSAPCIPYITNVTGSWVTDDEAADPTHWVRHMRQTVRFAEGLDELLQAPGALFLEVGPGQTFTSIIRRHPNSANACVTAPTLSSAPGWPDSGALAMSVARLWVAGVAPAWQKLHEGETRRRVGLPGYAFDRQRFWPQTRNNRPTREAPSVVQMSRHEPGIESREVYSGSLSTRTLNVAPERLDSIESKLLGVFESVLGTSSITVTDNFFELGGSSLSAMSVILQVERMFGLRLSAAALLESPTVEALAAVMSGVPSPYGHQLVGMRTTGAQPPLFCIHPYGGHTTNYVELTRTLGAAQPVYGIQAGGLRGESMPLRRIEDMASDYIELIKSVQPRGPYRLVGHSMGGCIAYEMAQQLNRNGESIALLALLDSRAQNASVRPLFRNGAYSEMAHRHWLSDDAVMLGILMPELSFDWDSLHDVDADAQWRHVREAAVKQGLLPTDAGEDQLRSLLGVMDANDEALRSYRPMPYAGPVLLVCGEEGFATQFGEPDLGWGALVDKLDIVSVPGNHHSIMSRASAPAIAEHLKRHSQRGGR
jgi:thioesterase domain-containing protein/acyl carrier protein